MVNMGWFTGALFWETPICSTFIIFYSHSWICSCTSNLHITTLPSTLHVLFANKTWMSTLRTRMAMALESLHFVSNQGERTDDKPGTWYHLVVYVVCCISVVTVVQLIGCDMNHRDPLLSVSPYSETSSISVARWEAWGLSDRIDSPMRGSPCQCLSCVRSYPLRHAKSIASFQGKQEQLWMCRWICQRAKTLPTFTHLEWRVHTELKWCFCLSTFRIQVARICRAAKLLWPRLGCEAETHYVEHVEQMKQKQPVEISGVRNSTKLYSIHWLSSVSCLYFRSWHLWKEQTD